MIALAILMCICTALLIGINILSSRAVVAVVQRSARATSTTIEHATNAAASRFDLAAARLPKTRAKRASKGEPEVES